jgi:hypothetical protein
MKKLFYILILSLLILSTACVNMQNNGRGLNFSRIYVSGSATIDGKLYRDNYCYTDDEYVEICPYNDEVVNIEWEVSVDSYSKIINRVINECNTVYKP